MWFCLEKNSSDMRHSYEIRVPGGPLKVRLDQGLVNYTMSAGVGALFFFLEWSRNQPIIKPFFIIIKVFKNCW